MVKNLDDAVLAQVRGRLCQAAESLLVAGGPSAVSMRAVAARLQVSPMTPYRYFESKEAMMNAVRVGGFERLAKVHDIDGSIGDLKPDGLLRDICLQRAATQCRLPRGIEVHAGRAFDDDQRAGIERDFCKPRSEFQPLPTMQFIASLKRSSCRPLRVF